MYLKADEVFVEPKEDDFPVTVGFRDHTANYVVVLSRFSDLEPDTGEIELVVGDQSCARTADVTVELLRSRCTIRLDEVTAAKLLGVREYVIDFRADETTFESMRELLGTLFRGLPGLTIR